MRGGGEQAVGLGIIQEGLDFFFFFLDFFSII